MKTPEQENAYCAFCLCEEEHDRIFIRATTQGLPIFICESCVAVCVEILAQHKKGAAVAPTTPEHKE